ncbi:uncharacterized protein LOC126292264 [Schistocerca gregaria]|uniref:uncharacterized protein LOC126292264 n=1 Tax=Schistocerca gregaria TaxID=7010 RepID=UPI00211EBD84|nr:uncharacterized protein LOC126292264 [Schistocerca gregaria]
MGAYLTIHLAQICVRHLDRGRDMTWDRGCLLVAEVATARLVRCLRHHLRRPHPASPGSVAHQPAATLHPHHRAMAHLCHPCGLPRHPPFGLLPPAPPPPPPPSSGAARAAAAAAAFLSRPPPPPPPPACRGYAARCGVPPPVLRQLLLVRPPPPPPRAAPGPRPPPPDRCPPLGQPPGAAGGSSVERMSLPDDLKKKCTDTQCDICSMTFGSPFQAKQHYSSRKHVLKVQKLTKRTPDCGEPDAKRPRPERRQIGQQTTPLQNNQDASHQKAGCVGVSGPTDKPNSVHPEATASTNDGRVLLNSSGENS